MVVADANATLEIMHAAYTRDTGAYKCKARNSAGSSQDIATVFIEKSDVPPYTAACKWLQLSPFSQFNSINQFILF